jgi:hypothetical protein
MRRKEYIMTKAKAIAVLEDLAQSRWAALSAEERTALSMALEALRQEDRDGKAKEG